MLVRAARRKAHPSAIRIRLSCEQLYLPWLCPAYNAPRREQRRPITAEAPAQRNGLRKRRNSNDGPAIQPRRSLATAATYDDIPFAEGPPPLTLSTKNPGLTSLAQLRPLNVESPMMFGGLMDPPPERLRMTYKSGVGGEVVEILSVFRACLAVGRMQRAGVILKRALKAEALTPDMVLSLQNEYLRAAVNQIQEKPSASATHEIHKWFELEIRNAGLLPDAETVIYMLKASLLSSRHDGDRRARLVRRYMDIAKQNDLHVLDLEMLGPADLNEITRICPELKFSFEEQTPEEEIAMLDTPNEKDGELRPPAPTPTVREVPQKGMGLSTLRHTLDYFLKRNDPDHPVELTPEEKREAQRQLETDAVSSAINRWREENTSLTKMGMSTALQTKSLGARMWRWHVALQKALKEELVKIEESESKERKLPADFERCTYGPFLRLLPPDQLAAATILAVMTTISTTGVDKGMPLAAGTMAISNSVEDEALFNKVQNSTKKPAWIRSKKDDRNRMTPALLRQAKRFRGSNVGSGADNTSSTDAIRSIITEDRWPPVIAAKVGAFLMSALIETAIIPVTLKHQQTGEMVTQMQPAFSHSHQYKSGKRIGVIIANSVLMKQLKREPVHSLLAKHLPMLVQPDPWTNFNKGGYISHPAKLVRIKLGDKDQRHYAEAAINKGDMEQTFKGLDVLGKTSWQINQPLFDVMLEAWNSGEAVANLAPENPKIAIPPEPDASQDPLERRHWLRALKSIENAKSGYHSQRCFQNFQLEIARALRNDEFYFPHNIDFRGRAYPIPPYLNHMGADHCRGLLMFGKGRELGASGLKWLKIHTANVFGFDKASLKEREDFTTKHLPKIYESVANPLGGSRWWLNAEDPWQFLAACMELKNALESPDPSKFISHLPIHQDGTCNGLQHYAALGGDAWGAKQVNLEPGDRPADVYTAVANLVKESVAADKAKGNAFAEILDGRITRKIVKQTVMTNVYGVTFIGAKAQVRKALVGLYRDLPNTEKMHPGVLAAYIATKIFDALASMFRGAHDIQYWLGECANRISQSLTPEQLEHIEKDPMQENTPSGKATTKGVPWNLDTPTQFKSSVIWTTPLHMPVVQPYRSTKTKSVITNMQAISISEPHRSNPVNKRKQLQGFPPNFIHSLDATHMLLSALRCDELGLSFAAVHDSFWTHAADIETMNTVLRDTFVRIHSEDVIKRLAAEFAARYKGCMYLAKVREDSPLHKSLVNMRRSIAAKEKQNKTTVQQGRLRELLLEYKRYKLLNSSDPKEVEEGKSMITPGSLFDSQAEVDLEPSENLSELGMGNIPSETAKKLKTFDPTTKRSDPDLVDLGDKFMEPESEQELTSFEKALYGQRRKKSSDAWVWLPLKFPPVPKRGEFDVSRLKNSNYFFS